MTYNKAQRLEYMRLYRAKRIRDARNKLGDRCVFCGSRIDLHFDHIVPSTKIKSISSMVNASKEDFERELLKCQLLCQKCHSIKTSKENGERFKKSITHGDRNGYRNYKCRCKKCQNWKKLSR